MRRLPTAVAVSAVLAALAPPLAARATDTVRPYAAEFRTASTTFQLAGRDGRTWLVGLTLEELRPVGGAVDRSLVVSLQPCTTAARGQVHCASVTTYRAPVAAGAVAANLGSAWVRTRVAGATVDLSWTAISGARTDTVASVSSNEVVARRAYEGGQGPVRGVVLGPRCEAKGSVGGGYVVRRAGPPARPGAAPPARLPAAIASSARWVPRCV